MEHLNTQYLRPLKAADLQKLYNRPFVRRSQLDIWCGSNAMILPLRKIPGDNILFGRGGVVDDSGHYVQLSALKDRVTSSYPVQEPLFRDEKVVYCGYLIHHWGHFLVEAVARLWYFLEHDETIDRYVFILEEGESRQISGNFREFLQLLGVWDKLEFVTRPTVFREVVVPEMAFQLEGCYSRKFLDIFDTVAANVQPDPSWVPSKKIYFSRSRLPKNATTEFGFLSLDNFFQRNGYEILVPEQLSLSQLIYQIRNAGVVASVSGTLPHNMLFANNGQTIQIMERFVLNNDFQPLINQMRALHAVYVDANIPIYTVSMAGPNIMCYNDLAAEFAKDHGLVPPDPKYRSRRFLKDCFVKYMKAYRKMYDYYWYWDEWTVPFADYLLEGYEAGYACFSDYLDGKRPFLWQHYFQPHYLKEFFKRLFK